MMMGYVKIQNVLPVGVHCSKQDVHVLTVRLFWKHVRPYNIVIIPLTLLRMTALVVKTNLSTDVLIEKAMPPMTIMIYVYVGQMQIGANFAQEVNTVTTKNTCVRTNQTRRVKIQTGCLPMVTQHVYAWMKTVCTTYVNHSNFVMPAPIKNVTNNIVAIMSTA